MQPALEAVHATAPDEIAIKRAYRKKALKLHPDVNKAADAEERFVECKMAYQTLTDPVKRRRAQATAQADFDWGTFVDGVSKQTKASSKAAEEAFYGFSDFFKDVDKELAERRARRAGKGPRTLAEELRDIGEEFIEFLEQGLQALEGSAPKRGQRAPGSSTADSSSASSTNETTARREVVF
eukprot:jgi/Astpho2/517/Aster-x0021